MLSEMRPSHLWLIVCTLLCVYVLLIYPLVVTERANSATPSLTHSTTHASSHTDSAIDSLSHSSTPTTTVSHLRSQDSTVATARPHHSLFTPHTPLGKPRNITQATTPSLTHSQIHSQTHSQTHSHTHSHIQHNIISNDEKNQKKKSKKRNHFVKKSYSNLIGWSSDFHISTVQDIKQILLKFEVKLIDKSLSGHCHLTHTCEEDLRVINQQNGITLSSCPNEFKKEFYEEYSSDEELLSVDFFLCTHASSMCELFMPFGKPIIVVASTRYEIGRHGVSEWREWNDYLALIMLKSKWGSEEVKRRSAVKGHTHIHSGGANVVAANNRYDQEYMQYFTGLDGIQLLPSICETFSEDSVRVHYAPTRQEILIAPSRDVNTFIANEIIAVASGKDPSSNSILSSFMKLAGYSINSEESSSGDHSSPTHAHGSKKLPSYTVKHIRQLYPHFQYTDLAAHPAVVLLPYQVSFMLFFELYSMNIPMFVPSPSLLTEWHLQHSILKERTWDSVFGHPNTHSPLPRHPHSTATSSLDPNNEFDREAILEWVSLADFYQFPHVTQFNNVSEFASVVASTDLSAISAMMEEFNYDRTERVSEQWSGVLSGVQAHKQAYKLEHGSSELPSDINTALAREYGVMLNKGCRGHHSV